MPHIYYYKSICVAFLMKETRKAESDRIKAKIAGAANVPKDVLLGVPILTLTGQIELCVENYRGIIEYTEELIRVQTKAGQLRIDGKRLQIDYYTNDEMKITGRIHAIAYQ